MIYDEDDSESTACHSNPVGPKSGRSHSTTTLTCSHSLRHRLARTTIPMSPCHHHVPKSFTEHVISLKTETNEYKNPILTGLWKILSSDVRSNEANLSNSPNHRLKLEAQRILSGPSHLHCSLTVLRQTDHGGPGP